MDAWEIVFHLIHKICKSLCERLVTVYQRSVCFIKSRCCFVRWFCVNHQPDDSYFLTVWVVIRLWSSLAGRHVDHQMDSTTAIHQRFVITNDWHPNIICWYQSQCSSYNWIKTNGTNAINNKLSGSVAILPNVRIESEKRQASSLFSFAC